LAKLDTLAYNCCVKIHRKHDVATELNVRKAKREQANVPALKSNVVSPNELRFIEKVYDAAGTNAEPFNKATLGKEALSTTELRKLQDRGILSYKTNGVRGTLGHTTVVLFAEPSALEARPRKARAAVAGSLKRSGKPNFVELYEFSTIFRKYIENVRDVDLKVDPAKTPQARELQGQIAEAATDGDVLQMQRLVSELAALHKTIARANAPRTKIEVAATRMVRDDSARWSPFLRLLADTGVK
jgi:hypothetical protein